MNKLTRNCPKCNQEIQYSRKDTLIDAERHSRKCSSCSKKGNKYRLGSKHSEETRQKMSKAHIGKVHSEEHRLNVSLSRRGKKHWLYGKKQTDEVKKKLSQSHKKRLEMFRENGIPFRLAGKIKTSYNPEACKLFDIINNQFNWNGKHALNGGEVEVGGYWVDFCEESVKLIIEYDEKHHQQPSRKDSDSKRQETIQKYLPEYTIIRIRNDECLETIIERLQEYANRKK